MYQNAPETLFYAWSHGKLKGYWTTNLSVMIHQEYRYPSSQTPTKSAEISGVLKIPTNPLLTVKLGFGTGDFAIVADCRELIRQTFFRE